MNTVREFKGLELTHLLRKSQPSNVTYYISRKKWPSKTKLLQIECFSSNLRPDTHFKRSYSKMQLRSDHEMNSMAGEYLDEFN